MNKVHRTLWNAVRGCYVVAHEKTTTGGKSSSTRKAIAVALSATLGVLASLPAQALPPSPFRTQNFTSTNIADGQTDIASAKTCLRNGLMLQPSCSPNITTTPYALAYFAEGDWTGVVSVADQNWLTFASAIPDALHLGMGSTFQVLNMNYWGDLVFGGLTLYQTSGGTKTVTINVYNGNGEVVSTQTQAISDATATPINVATSAGFNSVTFTFDERIPFGATDFLIGASPATVSISDTTPGNEEATLSFYEESASGSITTGYELSLEWSDSTLTLVLPGTTSGTTVTDASTGITATLGANNTIRITGLTNDTSYSAKFAAKSDTGVGIASEASTFTPVASFVLSVTPTLNVSGLVVNASLTSNSDQAYAHWVVLPAGAEAPTAEQIAYAEDSSGTSLPDGSYGSTDDLSASSPLSFAIAGLTPNTTYSICVVGQAYDDDSYSEVTCREKTTGAAPANPICSNDPACLAGLYYTGQSSGGTTTVSDGSIRQYSYSFTANQTTTAALTFLFRQDPYRFLFGNVSLVDNAAPGVNLISNGNFSDYTSVNLNDHSFKAPVAWSLVGTPGLDGSGELNLGEWENETVNAWSDGSVGGFGGLAQAVSYIDGHTYTLTFDLQNNDVWGGLSAANFDVTAQGEENPTDDPYNILTQFFVFKKLPSGFATTGGNLNPTATVNDIASTPRSGAQLTGGYNYSFATGEGTSTYQWYSSSDTTFSNASFIDGATSLTYMPGEADVGKHLFFCVTPKAAAGATGYQSCSTASAAVLASAPPAPVVEVTPPTPVNPFNTDSTSTIDNLLTNSGGAYSPGGETYTPATASLIENLSEVSKQAGISSKGIISIVAVPNVAIKIAQNTPSGVLFSLQAGQTIPLQIGGQLINVTTNNQQITDSTTGKITPTVLATKTVTNSAGVSTQTLFVASGQATISSAANNQTMGGLTLSQGATLNNVVATAGASDSSASFYKNPNDLSGSIAADNGTVLVDLTLAAPPATADKSNKFLSDTSAKRTFILKAGEVARFDAKANLIGIFAGSLSGTAGKTGDALVVTPPIGVSNYPKAVARLDGNTLGRLGKNLLPAFLDAVTPAASGSSPTSNFSLAQDTTSGIVKLTYHGRDYFGLPLMPVPVDTTGTVPDGGALLADGTVVWTEKGISVRFAPTVADLPSFAKAALAHGVSTQVEDDGTLKLATSGTVFYARPRFSTDAVGGSAGFAVNPTYNNAIYTAGDGTNKVYGPTIDRVTFTGADGKTQIFDPTVYNAAQINDLVEAVGPGWRLSRGNDGLLLVSGPSSQVFKLLPDYAVSIDTSAQTSTNTVPKAWLDNNGKLFIRYNTGFIPMSQGFNVQ